MADKKVLKTRLCEMLGIEYPILLAGMGSAAGPSLVAAVSNAGGFGVLGASGMSPDEVRGWIKKTKSLTDKPFGLDLILPHEISSNITIPKNLKEILPPEHVAFVENLMKELELPEVETKDFWSRISFEVCQEVVKVCIEEGVALFVSGLGNPDWVVPDAHERGMLVSGCVGNTKNAVRLKDSGVDFVIAQGYDGGGHTGRIGTLSLIPQAVDAVSPLPVVAAGGIVDGRGLAASLALGAEGVWVGTAFLATKEANADAIEDGYIFFDSFWDEVWKRRLLEAIDEDTVVSKISTGKTARHIKNKLIDIWDKSGVSYLPMPFQGFLAWDLYASIAKSGKSELVVPLAGQGAGMIKEIRSPGEILNDMVEGALEIFQTLESKLGI